MQSSAKWVSGALVVGAVVVAGLGVLALFVPLRSDTDPGPDGPTVVTEAPGAPNPAGEWFGPVTVDEDETGQLTLGVDWAGMPHEGNHVGPSVYGKVDHQPVAKDLTIRDGLVASSRAEHLP